MSQFGNETFYFSRHGMGCREKSHISVVITTCGHRYVESGIKEPLSVSFLVRSQGVAEIGLLGVPIWVSAFHVSCSHL